MTERSEAWATALTVLSNGLRHPDAELRDALESDADVLSATLAEVGVDADQPPSIADRDLTEDYEALFGAYLTPFAPPAASPYKEWYGDRSGLMGGPPASAMEQRYDALEADVPEAYPPDHVALELEYASLLAEAEQWEDLAAFVAEELDWIEAFASVVDEAAAEAPLQRFCVTHLVSVIEQLRSELDVAGPDDETIEKMANRARSNAD
jgi:TorA maturation chaperone TorD